MKKNQVESQLKEFKTPLQNQRLMIIACISACNRRRIIVRYNHEKLKEIKKFQQNQSSFGASPIQHNGQSLSAGVAQPSSNLENHYHQNFTQSNANYLHDMKQHQDAITAKVEHADKILVYELKYFKDKLVRDFQTMVADFNKAKAQESKQVTELWDAYLQQIAAQDYY